VDQEQLLDQVAGLEIDLVAVEDELDVLNATIGNLRDQLQSIKTGTNE